MLTGPKRPERTRRPARTVRGKPERAPALSNLHRTPRVLQNAVSLGKTTMQTRAWRRSGTGRDGLHLWARRDRTKP